MLKVDINLHPFGDENNSRTIRFVCIANSGLMETKSGKTMYKYWVDIDPRDLMIKLKPHGKVFHLRDAGAYELLYKVMKQMKRKNLFST